MNARRWYNPVTKTAATEIIKKTRISCDLPPDPVALAQDINVAFSSCEWLWRLQFSGSRTAHKIATTFASGAKRLNDQINDAKCFRPIETFVIFGAHAIGAPNETYRQFGIEDIDPRTPIELDSRVEVIVPKLMAAVSLIAKWARAGLKQREIGSPRSAIEILIAQALPYFFTKHFEHPFGAGTAGDKNADGPGIRFVMACLEAGSIRRSDGEAYSAETVRTYWQAFKAKKLRRSSKSRKPERHSGVKKRVM
jgi:hypothetical protein